MKHFAVKTITLAVLTSLYASGATAAITVNGWEHAHPSRSTGFPDYVPGQDPDGYGQTVKSTAFSSGTWQRYFW